jgi:predicted metal-dependent phosphotriesterase family hydrolase
MSQVATVRGPLEAADLGPTYMHEHIFVLTADVQQNYPGEWGSEDERIADAVTKLRALAAQGVRTAGVEPGRVVPGHSGDTTDCDHLAELAAAGFVLGMDRFGLNAATTFEARAGHWCGTGGTYIRSLT